MYAPLQFQMLPRNVTMLNVKLLRRCAEIFCGGGGEEVTHVENVTESRNVRDGCLPCSELHKYSVSGDNSSRYPRAWLSAGLISAFMGLKWRGDSFRRETSEAGLGSVHRGPGERCISCWAKIEQRQLERALDKAGM